MVKVLQIDLFEKGGILPLTSVPIAVTATADFVLVAFANGTITRYDATEGKALSSFKTRGTVTAIEYSEVSGALFTLEHVAQEDTTEVDYVFPKNDDGMAEWRVRSGPSERSPVIAKLKVGQRFVVTHVEDPWVRVVLDGVVGWTRPAMKGTRYLHRATKQQQRTLPRLYFSWRAGTAEEPAVAEVVRQVEHIEEPVSPLDIDFGGFDLAADLSRSLSGIRSNGPSSRVGTPPIDESGAPSRSTSRDGSRSTSRPSSRPGSPTLLRKRRVSTVKEVKGGKSHDRSSTALLLLMDHPDTNASTLSVCPATGNVAVGSDSFVCVYHIATEPGVKMITKLFTLVPRCPVRYVALCRDFVGYASTSEVYVLRVGLRPTNEVGATPENNTATSAPATERADNVDWEDHPRCVRLGNKAATESSLFTIGVPFTTYTDEPKEKLEIVRKEQTELLGPIAVADQGVKSNPTCGFAVTTVECYLYRNVGTKNDWHTLILLPAHTQGLVELSANHSWSGTLEESPLLPGTVIPGGVCCFLSHENQGYMYGLHGGTTPLSTYSYMQPSNSAAISDCMLFVTTAGDIGCVETYTIRNVLYDDLADMQSEAPDVSFLSSKQMFSPDSVRIGDRNAVVLVKHEEDTGSSFQKGVRAKESSFNVYFFRTYELDQVVEMIKEVGAEFSANWPHYNHVLSEANFLLRAKVGALSGLTLKRDSAAVREKYVSLLRKSCLEVVDHLLQKRGFEWGSTVPYFVAAHLPLSEVVGRFVDLRPGLKTAHTQSTDGVIKLEGADLQAALALLEVTDIYLFDPAYHSLIDDSMALANLLIGLYWLLSFDRLPDIILHSTLSKFSSELAITLLKGPPPGLEPTSTASRTIPLALCMIYLKMGDDESAAAQVAGHLDETIALCVANSKLLGHDECLDPIQVDDLATDSNVSKFAQLLRTHFADTLTSILLSLHGQISVVLAVRCLIGGIKISLSGLQTVTTYLTETLAKDEKVPLAHAAKQMCIFTLVKFRLRRLTLLQTAPEVAVSGQSEESVGVVDTSSRAFKRAKWLLLPELQPSIPSAALQELRRLQALLLEYVLSDTAEDLFSIISAGDDFPGRITLQLICLPVMGLLYSALRDILRLFPTALIGYCKYMMLTHSMELGDWKWLQAEVATLAEDDTHKDVYQDFLMFSADVLAPEDFLQILPDDGNMMFYSRYIERSYRRAPIRILENMIVKRAALLE